MPALKDTQSGSSAGPPAPQHGAALCAAPRRGSPAAQQSAAAQLRQVFGAAGGRLRQVVGCGRWSAAAGGREAVQVPAEQVPAEQVPAEPLPDARLTARQVVGKNIKTIL